ncbi:hypothetical protein G6L68_25515 [Agrobacterium fabrum]|uniref:hypothetical protein n=1 Tax=Agrobacterium fabrum TaxID=1176649 RepID=UPI000EF5E768|nr:hypothetical protein [Agrobacterium fabrum]AYM66146.1 hypothetical protein At12D13_49940 [Agrobacterium fabrum]NTE63994.1 hypothetical protein [Agrobacterium fabrum]
MKPTVTLPQYVITIENARARIRKAGFSTRLIRTKQKPSAILIPELGTKVTADHRGWLTVTDLLVALKQRRAA